MMGAIVDEAQAAGAPGAVLESQVQAIGFYEKLGFVPEGAEFMDAGIPHILMRRPFEAP
jgi:predicted GNAT family N-acyltransferase